MYVLRKDEQGAVKNASASKRNDILISNQQKYNEYILRSGMNGKPELK